MSRPSGLRVVTDRAPGLDIRDAAGILAALARVNVRDCERNVGLLGDLTARCFAAAKGETLDSLRYDDRAPFRYEDEPRDEWRSFSVMAEQHARRTMVADAPDLATTWAAFFALWISCSPSMRDVRRVGVAVTIAPATKGHAYVYVVLEGAPGATWRARCVEGQNLPPHTFAFDGAALAAARTPPEALFGSERTEIAWL